MSLQLTLRGTTGGSGVLTGAQTQNVQICGGTFFWSRVVDEFLSWIFTTIVAWYNSRSYNSCIRFPELFDEH